MECKVHCTVCCLASSEVHVHVHVRNSKFQLHSNFPHHTEFHGVSQKLHVYSCGVGLMWSVSVTESCIVYEIRRYISYNVCISSTVKCMLLVWTIDKFLSPEVRRVLLLASKSEIGPA